MVPGCAGLGRKKMMMMKKSEDGPGGGGQETGADPLRRDPRAYRVKRARSVLDGAKSPRRFENFATGQSRAGNAGRNHNKSRGAGSVSFSVNIVIGSRVQVRRCIAE